jgi:hypothetical protein
MLVRPSPGRDFSSSDSLLLCCSFLSCASWPSSILSSPRTNPTRPRHPGTTGGQQLGGPGRMCQERSGLAAAFSEGPHSDAHESSILAEVLGLASIFLPRNRLALLEPYSINSPSPATHFPLGHGFLRPSTPLASPREAAALPDDPRLASCSTRRLVCITGTTAQPAEDDSGPVLC